MSEDALRVTVRDRLGPYGRLTRIENKISTGVPDIAYTLCRASGWLELKFAARWPVRPATPLTIEHLTLEQVLWLEAEDRAGGRAWCLLQVCGDYLLLAPPAVRALYIGGIGRVELRARAAVFSEMMFPTKKILRELSKHDSHHQPIPPQ